jgi:uncharacterized iron-regulated membrane protein
MRLRRALFQVHLWTALTLGVYIVVISVSGSIAVFRREASIWLIPRTVPSIEGERLTGETLDAAVRRVYSGYEVVGISEQFGGRRGPDPALRPVDVALVKDGVRTGRVFDPYAAQDLGDNYPPLVRAMEWTVRLHDDLVLGTLGRRINGIGGALVMLLVVTGAVVWWQGKSKWWRGTIVSRAARRPVLWQLHSALGFWAFALLFIWAITAVYFAFPTPVEALIDYFDPDLEDFHRPGEAFLLQVIALHFGRFGGLEVRIAWAILGLAPAALFITGFIVWWRRVVRPRFAVRRDQNVA